LEVSINEVFQACNQYLDVFSKEQGDTY
jgi:hypothetical protein